MRVLAWYDNEWGFSCRMADVAQKWARCKPHRNDQLAPPGRLGHTFCQTHPEAHFVMTNPIAVFLAVLIFGGLAYDLIWLDGQATLC